MNYTDYYFEQKFGCYPYENQNEYLEVDNVISYLKENDLSDKQIINFLNEACKSKLSVRKELTNQEWLTADSLLKPGVFYHHPKLQIQSPAPSFNPFSPQQEESKFYREMKIKFTLEDILNYAYSKLGLITELKDKKRDIGSIEYLLKKYARVDFVQPIDFLLYLMDEASRSDRRIASILDIAEYEVDTFESLKRHVMESKAKKADVIVWR